MRILAFGAHPDDIEIFMFGTLSIFQEQSNEVFLAIATDGSKGGINPGMKLALKRKKETLEALSDFKNIKFFNFPDGNLSTEDKANKNIFEYINDLKPNLIITHYKKDYHSDHRALSKIVRDVTSFQYPILYCDTMMGINFNPNIYINISKYFDQKEKSILKHKSQNPKKYVKIAKIMNKFRAAQCNMFDGYCEAFYFKGSYPFSDIRSLIPNNMIINNHEV